MQEVSHCKKTRVGTRTKSAREEEQAELFKHALISAPFKTVSLDNFPTGDPLATLNIIGNGFDLMHGVKSSYYNFSDTHINSDAMFGVVDMWLDDFDAYDPDVQAADFFAAVDAATGPAQTITHDLPRRFRMWIETLKVPDIDYRPLNGLIRNSKTLNFNYTEFIEDLYGVDKENVCYIHGCRRKEKYHPKDKLILGHVPGAGDNDIVGDYRLPKYKNSRKRYMVEAAIDTAARNLSWYDEETTKNCKDIIKSHQEFFDDISNVNRIIVVGHSLSPVDWDYFKKIISVNKNKNNIDWYFSCHSPRNIENIKMFADAMGIRMEQITLFIT